VPSVSRVHDGVRDTEGKVQEEELDSGVQPASGGREWRMRVQGETGTGSPCAIFQ
jgi:hypothetical protein